MSKATHTHIVTNLDKPDKRQQDLTQHRAQELVNV